MLDKSFFSSCACGTWLEMNNSYLHQFIFVKASLKCVGYYFFDEKCYENVDYIAFKHIKHAWVPDSCYVMLDYNVDFSGLSDGQGTGMGFSD